MSLFRFQDLYIAHLQQLCKQSGELVIQYRTSEQKDLERYVTGQLKGIQLALEALEIVSKSPEYLYSVPPVQAQEEPRQ